MKISQYSKCQVESITFEHALMRINENGKGYEYLSAYRFHDKKFVDKSGNIQTIAFSDNERLQCIIEKIEHLNIMLTRKDVIDNQDACINYNTQLKEFKDALFKLFEEVRY